jgi:hypothetical protein
VTGVSATDIVVGQMDNDPALEIALTNGSVIDASTHAVQWHRPDGFGAHLAVANLDKDGRQELIAAEQWYIVRTFDVEKRLPKSSIPAELDIGAIAVTDIDGDGVQDLLVGDGQWGSIHVYDPRTGVEKWAITNPEHGVTNIAVADVDGDGTVDLLWGAGATSTGSDRLYVADWQVRTIKWQNPQLDGPFVGPEIGDLDGDGIPEIVAASFTSESGYESGSIIVLDSRTFQLRAIFSGFAGRVFGWTGVHDLKLRDLNGDGRLEILVAGDWLYDGLIEAYSFNASNEFTLLWTNATRPDGAPFHSVDAVDVNGDGKLEIIGGGGREHTGALGVFIYAYALATGAEKWHTLQVGDYWSKIARLGISDTDGDGDLDIAGLVNNGDVYVFNGPNHTLKAIISAQATAFDLMNWTNRPQIITGDATGMLSVFQHNGTTYSKVTSMQLTTTRLDGIELSSGGAIWAGSLGVLSHYSAGIENFRSANYGTPLGASVALLPAGNLTLSAGLYGVHAFKTQP